MLEFVNVSFAYDDHEILRDVSFSVAPGDFAFLIGRSGCGKSTLLQHIYMNQRPHAGEVRFDKYSSATVKRGEIAKWRRKIGVVFQDFRLLKDRDIYDNIAFALEVTKTPAREIKRRVNEALIEVGLNHRRSSYPDELSGGEQQRAGVARAIANEPALVVADEPTGNLDPNTSLEILSLFKRINKKGAAVLFATHNYDLIKHVDARIYKLEDGKASSVRIKKKPRA